MEERGGALPWFAIAGGILLFGLVMLGSATAPIGAERYGNTYYFLLRQLGFGVLPGALLFYIVRRIPIAFWERNWSMFFWISVVLLGSVFIPGIGMKLNGSHSWLNFRFFSVQPAEFVKVTFFIFAAGWLAQNARYLSQRFEDGLLKYLVYLGVVCGMLMLQPDLGTVLVFFGTSLTLAFIAGARWQHMGALAGAGLVALVILILIAPYRMQRITAVINPDADPYGSGYHIKQALTAVGSGGVLGKGLGNSRQKFQYLPEVSADSIFAVIAEEMGLIVSGILIFAYAIFVVKGYGLAQHADSAWSRYFIIGTVTWLGIQATLNIGAMLGVLPLTGLPLPLVSHGGSSLMATFVALGIISVILMPPERTARRRG